MTCSRTPGGPACSRRMIMPELRRPRRPGWAAPATWSAATSCCSSPEPGTLAYPTAADWFSDITHASAISGYVHDVDRYLRATHSRALLGRPPSVYNAHLPDGPLRDPYTLNAEGKGDSVEEGATPTSAAVASSRRLRWRACGSRRSASTCRCTTARTTPPWRRGSATCTDPRLPVGGAGTHAVLTGHSGRAQLDPVHPSRRMRGRATCSTSTSPGRSWRTAVDQIKVVKPDDGDDLRQVPGHDYVTLLTCTPDRGEHPSAARARRTRGHGRVAERPDGCRTGRRDPGTGVVDPAARGRARSRGVRRVSPSPACPPEGVVMSASPSSTHPASGSCPPG